MHIEYIVLVPYHSKKCGLVTKYGVQEFSHYCFRWCFVSAVLLPVRHRAMTWTKVDIIWLDPWEQTSSMMTSLNGNIFRVTGHLSGEFTGSRWIPRTKASDAEVWCILWINGWGNNREAGDLRRYRAYYDARVMKMATILFRPRSQDLQGVRLVQVISVLHTIPSSPGVYNPW